MSKVRLSAPDRVLFRHELPVRISDMNYGNHLGHDHLVTLLHEARVRFFRAHEMSEVDIDGCGILLVDLAVSYRAQVFFGQTLYIDVGAGDVSSRGCDLIYRVTDKESGQLVALGKTGIVFFDYARQRVVNMPPRFAELISAPREGTTHD